MKQPSAILAAIVLSICCLAGCLAVTPSPDGAGVPVESPMQTATAAQDVSTATPSASLSPSSALAGTVLATSSPSGADLYWDGNYRGTTPASIEGVLPGAHVVRMSAVGHQEYMGSVTVAAGETESVNAVLAVSAEGPRQVNTTFLEERVHDLVNVERNRNGLISLDMDLRLSVIARNHSQDMAANSYFAHVNLQGQSPTDRGDAAGYTCRKDYGSYYTFGIAENLFQNNLYDSVTYMNGDPISYDWNSIEEIAGTSVEGWMESPGHRKNILTSTFDREGIGVAVAADDKMYVTEDFC
jgi:uncharacterized protein YkwD